VIPQDLKIVAVVKGVHERREMKHRYIIAFRGNVKPVRCWATLGLAMMLTILLQSLPPLQQGVNLSVSGRTISGESVLMTGSSMRSSSTFMMGISVVMASIYVFSRAKALVRNTPAIKVINNILSRDRYLIIFVRDV